MNFILFFKSYFSIDSNSRTWCIIFTTICLFVLFFIISLFFFFFLFSISFSFVWGMRVINVIDCESLWVMDSQNKKSKGQYCPCLNIFLMKISGVCLSFSRGWLTKEWEREVHLGVPFYIYRERERERERERDIYCRNPKIWIRILSISLWNGEALVHCQDLERRVSMVKNVPHHLKC